VKVGDSLWLTGADKPMRVRGLHAQNSKTDTACAGQRIALNISGDAEKLDIKRGDWLLAEKSLQPVERVIVQLQSHAPLQQWQPLHIHHAASHVTGRISLLEDDLAELVLDVPLCLAENDRLVLRDISARVTLAGARAILLHAPRRGKRQPAFLAWLQQLKHAETDRQTLDIHLQRSAVTLTDFAWARQLTTQGLQELLTHPDFLRAGNSLLSDEMAVRWKQKLLDTLERYHQQHDDQPGPGRERLRRMALPSEDEPLVLALIEKMRQEGLLASRQGWLHLPDHKPGFSAEQLAVWQKVDALFGDEPWWVRDLARETQQDEQAMRQLLRFAAQLGLVTAIIKDRYYRNDRIQVFANLIRELDQTQGATSAADFRDSLGVGRKLAVQILEYFDRIGFTRRRGNDHLLRDKALFMFE
jgi:selenocysteine-specific elongation factor